MSIPDYATLMLPLLRFAADEKDHSLAEATNHLARQFGVTSDERQELLQSGRQPVFDNRIGWARTYLRKALLLESTGRGIFRITARGLELLKANPEAIDARLLRRYPEFVEFEGPTSKEVGPSPTTVTADQTANLATPSELLTASYQELRRALAQDLLDAIKKCSPAFFEQLVVDLLVGMGYGGTLSDAGRAVGQTGDDGIDGIIKEDKLGLDVIYVQAKRWEGTVGRPVVQAFAGSLEGQRARKGVLMTTSRFSQEARDYVERIEKRIVLIDGEQLTELMIDHNIGVTEEQTYVVKRLDSGYFGFE